MKPAYETPAVAAVRCRSITSHLQCAGCAGFFRVVVLRSAEAAILHSLPPCESIQLDEPGEFLERALAALSSPEDSYANLEAQDELGEAWLDVVAPRLLN